MITSLEGLSMYQKHALLLIGLGCACASTVHADRGSIPFMGDVEVYEPNQDALIAWNGVEEILLLRTKLRASKKTKLLEVLPLPAEPVVKKGDSRAFKQATRLLNRPRRPSVRSKSTDLGNPFMDGPPEPAAVVTWSKTIGVHEINVVKVLHKDAFVSWVKRFLKKKGAGTDGLSKEFIAIVEEYLQQKFIWFVFNVVAVGPKLQSMAPISYRFATPRLFYPLKITRLEKRWGKVRLLVLSPNGVVLDQQRSTLRPKKRGQAFSCRRKVYPFRLTTRQLGRIGSDYQQLMGEKKTKLSMWQCAGLLAAADFDILGKVKPPRAKNKRSPKAKSKRRRKATSPTVDLSNPFE